jgi:hypothetical protein
MFNRLMSGRAAWVGLGVLVGMVIGGFLPHAPLHAVATDRAESFAMATGMLDQGVEAVYTLDFLTGDLGAAVLNPQTKTFTATYKRNILQDLKVQAGNNPKFMMVTGQADLRTQGQLQFGASVVYVAELGSGMMGVYALPFNPAMLNNNTVPRTLDFVPVFAAPFRSAAVRK